ncbi:MAG: Ser-Thr-rich GPI-anchored membrane family protein [Candidatus Hydrogenedentes bacterium]|nr:Ser-Thr-rich GPI-anchored membrane family protein [Candidatus Hydrogenedentota bacterium]
MVFVNRVSVALISVFAVSGVAAHAENIIYGPLSGHPEAVESSASGAKGQSALFSASVLSITPPTLPEGASAYLPNGSFVVSVDDLTGCGALFDLTITSAPFSIITGSSRVSPVTSLGFSEGDFEFTDANPGAYTIEIVQHNPCNPDVFESQFVELVVPNGTAPAITLSATVIPASLPSADAGFTPDGTVTVSVGDATGCVGSYNVQYISGPFAPSVTAYLGFPAGDLLFDGIGPGTYLFRVTEIGSCTLQTDPSDITVIVPDVLVGAITVLKPNGGEKWKAGSNKDITWTTSGIVGIGIRIELLRNGELQQVIKASTPNDGLFKWKLPNDLNPAKGYVVRISSVTDPAIVDFSDASFRVKPQGK